MDLHERFECGGGWGLERTFDQWVLKQPWRKCMPQEYFELLNRLYAFWVFCFVLVFWMVDGLRKKDGKNIFFLHEQNM